MTAPCILVAVRRAVSLWLGATSVAALAAGALAACGSDTPPPADGGSSSDVSAATDASAGTGAGPDASADAAPDAVATLRPCPAPSEGLVTLEDAPLSVVVDGSSVLWVSSAPTGAGFSRSVRRAEKNGGLVDTLATTPRDVGAVASTKGAVIWNEPAEGAEPAVLRIVDAGSKDVRVLATFDAALGAMDPFVLAADDAHAYALFRQGTTRATYTVYAVALATGAIRAVARHALDVGITARALSVEGADLFWGYTGGFLYRAPRAAAGVNATLVFDDARGLDAWAVRTSDVLVAQEGSMLTVPRAGGASTGAGFGSSVYRTVHARGDVVVWGARDAAGAETIVERRADGSECVIGKTDVKSVFSMTSDGERVYYANTATRAAGGAVRWAALVK